MDEFRRRTPPYPMTADFSAALAAARQQRAEASLQFFVGIGALIRGIVLRGRANALRPMFRRSAFRLGNGTAR